MKQKQFIFPVYLLLLIVMFILPYFSADKYSVLSNTTSELGAQSTPNAWIMNMTFGLLGIACITDGALYLKKNRIQQVLLFTFGISLILTGLYQHAPIDETLSYDLLEDKLHSIFSTVVGFSFSIFSISTIFIEKRKTRRIITLITVFLTTVFSVLMSTIPIYAGIWQRLIFISSFAWIIFFIKNKRIDTSS